MVVTYISTHGNGVLGTKSKNNEYEFKEVDGEINEVLQINIQKYNNNFPKNFISRVIELDKSGKRTGTPESIDHWIKQ